MQTENFCIACESFNSQTGYDYSGGPGVTKCSCGRKSTIVEVPEGNRDLVKQANQTLDQMFPRVMTEMKQGRLDASQVEELIEKADPDNFKASVDYRHAEEALFELFEEIR